MTASPPPSVESLHLAGTEHHGARFVCASVGAHRLAFPIAAVSEVLAPRAITRLFHAPPSLLGVVNLRGEILPVVDLLQLLDEAAMRPRSSGSLDEGARLVVLRARLAPDPGARGGLAKTSSIAVRVSRLDPLRDGDVQPLPAGVPEGVSRFAVGIVTDAPSPAGAPSHAVLVIDPDRLVEVEELALLRE